MRKMRESGTSGPGTGGKDEVQVGDDLERLAKELERRDGALAGRLRGLLRDRDALGRALADLEHERRQIEQARREWVTALDAVQDPIFLHDKDLRVVRANRAYAARAGVDVREVAGKPYWQLFPKLDGPLAGCLGAMEKNQGSEEEVQLPGGETFLCRNYPIRDADGHYLYSLHLLQDVTERRKAEAEQRILSEALRQAAEAVIVLDRDLRITYVNPAFQRMFGYLPEEIRGQPLSVLTVPGFPDPLQPADVARRVHESGGWQGEVQRRAKDGTAVPVLLSASAIRDEKDAVTGYVGTYLDLREIRHAEQRFRALIEGSSDIITLFGRDGSIGYVSPSAQRLLGYAPEELLGTNAFRLIHSDDVPQARETFAQCLQNPSKAYDIAFRLRCKDGDYIHAEAIGRNLLGDPAVAGVVVNTRDITERTRAARALRTLSECNAALVRAQSEPELLREICRIIVEAGGYHYAWVGYAERDEAKRIRPLAQAGFEPDVFEKLPLTWADDEAGQVPAGVALREGAAAVVRDVAGDPALAPWRPVLAQLGVNALCAFPLMQGDEPFGVLSICSREPDAFDRDELMLLEELAEDLNFGILTLRTHDAHERLQREHLKDVERLKEALTDAIRAIALTVEKRDPYTAGHQQRVSELCVAIGRELGLPVDRLEGLRLGALIHDLGKVSVPAEILNRPGRLTPAEFEIIKSHPEVGYDIVKDVKFPWPVAQMILQHHERLDGSGYPQGLKDEAILSEARILAVADTVEAMGAHRPYRPARGVEAGLEEIERRRGTWYDPDVVDACLRLFREKGFKFG